jgi:hypothetical protein
MIAMKERLRDLDFEESFIEKTLKDFPAKKIEEKLDLLMEKRNIQSPAGWLSAALKYDYQEVEEERYEEEPERQASQPLRIDSRFRGNDIIPNVMASSDSSEHSNLVNTPEQVSREKALEAIRLIQKNLSNCISPLPSKQENRSEKSTSSPLPWREKVRVRGKCRDSIH